MQLHRNFSLRLEPLGKRARARGLLAFLPAQRDRQPDHDALGALLVHQPGERREPAWSRGAPPRAAAWRACRMGPRSRSRSGPPRGRAPGCAPSAAAAPLDRRAPRRAPRAASRGRAPPACAIVSRPPPPPPTTWAAARTTSPAFTPRSTAAGRDVGHQVHAAVDRGAEHHRRVAQLLAHGVGEREQRLGVRRAHRLHDHAPRHLVGAGHERSARSRSVSAPAGARAP